MQQPDPELTTSAGEMMSSMLTMYTYTRRAAMSLAIFGFVGALSLQNAVGSPIGGMRQETATAEKEAVKRFSKADSLKRITYDIEYLSTDEMGGRQPGTPGIRLAEEYIVAEYKKAGLKPLENGTYFQTLEVRGTKKVDRSETSLVLAGPGEYEISLELGKEYQQFVGRNEFDLSKGIVFVGYGITANEHNYDDYARVDVAGKIVVLIRREPQSGDPASVFDGENTSRHASGRAKITAARRAGAAAILMVNDGANAPSADQDELVASDRFGSTSMPFAQIKRSVLDEILIDSPIIDGNGKKLDSLAKIEQAIDSNLEPLSQPFKGWKAKFKSKFINNQVKTHNIIGIIEGEGPHADETIVIGGHYDHLGTGAYGSRAGGRRGIHNGADDNATGTAAVIELARRINQREKKPARRLVFICFTAEEMGLLGAYHYCEEPVFPLETTAAMVNFDMIGWLRNDKLTVYNWNTSPLLGPIIRSVNEPFGMELVLPNALSSGSDQLPFNQKNIPNVFIHTGLTDVYHTPEDDFEAINCEGALRVIDFSEKFIDSLASLEKMPRYGVAKPFRLGVMLDDVDNVVTVEAVISNSVAETSGLNKGDVILEIDGKKMTRRRNVTLAIRRGAGKTVKMKVKRGDSELTLDIELVRPEDR